MAKLIKPGNEMPDGLKYRDDLYEAADRFMPSLEQIKSVIAQGDSMMESKMDMKIDDETKQKRDLATTFTYELVRVKIAQMLEQNITGPDLVRKFPNPDDIAPYLAPADIEAPLVWMSALMIKQMMLQMFAQTGLIGNEETNDIIAKDAGNLTEKAIRAILEDKDKYISSMGFGFGGLGGGDGPKFRSGPKWWEK